MITCLNIVIPSKLNGIYSYLPLDNSDCQSFVGKRVLVPFGKKNITGIAISITKIEEPSFKLKKIIDCLDKQVVFEPNFIKLLKWVSNYYYSDIGMTFKTALPSGLTPEKRIYLRLKEEPLAFGLSNLEARLINMLNQNNLTLDLLSLEKSLKTKNLLSQISNMISDGFIVVQDKKINSADYKVITTIKVNRQHIDNIDSLEEYLLSLPRNSKAQIRILNYFLSNFEEDISLSELSKKLSISQSSINNLINKNILSKQKQKVNRSEDFQSTLANKNELGLDLNQEQEDALTSMTKSIDKKEFMVHLLFGVTGSGKSLVYFHLIKKVLAQKKTILVLLPEISLASQFLLRIEKAFPKSVNVFHSKLSMGQRFDSWQAIANNEAKIILGTRSSLFLPIKNLGLIIVDEEHETSFKQEDPEPRYHGRDMAIMRAKLENITIILGSATPSFESMYNAIAGKYILNEIKNRADDAKLPEVTLIDTLAAKNQSNLIGSMSKDLLESIEASYDRREKVIIYQNRRGYSAYCECQDCGDIPMCVNCDISLTYHKVHNKLTCHYCGYFQTAQSQCKECGSNSYEIIGYGTQRVEEEINEYFNKKGKSINIEIVDLDSTSKKGSFLRIIENFNSGDTDLIVGTQMIAKGLDLAKVTLVGVVNADLQLFIPDFRASERTFQLLTQVAGRAGRRNEYKGKVIIQSHHPENYTLIQSARHDFTSFYEEEIQMREAANYPPYTRFIKIEFKSKKEDKIVELANEFYKLLEENKYYYLIYEPVVPVIFKLHNNFRAIMIIKSNKESDQSGKFVRQAIRKAEKEFAELDGSSTVRVTVDIDTYASF